MANPPSLPSQRPDYTNGSSSRTTPPSLTSPRLISEPPPTRSGTGLGFLLGFLSALGVLLILSVIGVGVYFGATYLASASSKESSPLQRVSAWQPGKQAAQVANDDAKPDIGWWASHFNLPKSDEVQSYLKTSGLAVTRLEPLHYVDTPEATTLTYRVYGQVPEKMLRLQAVPWRPNDPDLEPFTQVTALNRSLSPGLVWDTRNVFVAADAGSKLQFNWQVVFNKTDHTVITERLPLPENVFTQQQVNDYQTEAAQSVAALKQQVAEINTRAQNNLQARLAQIPADPPKPALLSRKFGGNGSGEPTRSAERIGGGTVAGAAGGAIFGAVANDPGLGAGIGAGAGLLGGIIYDTVSKNDDKKKHEAKVDAENARRQQEWKAQVAALAKQRKQAEADAVTEKQQALTDLANRLAQVNGNVLALAPTAVEPVSTAPAPTGPVVAPPANAETKTGPITKP